MNDSSKNEKTAGQPRPAAVIRNGAIAASVWKRETPEGDEYFDYSISRAWKSKSGDQKGYSSNFFANNEDAIVAVIVKASRFIRENSSGDKSVVDSPAANQSSNDPYRDSN